MKKRKQIEEAHDLMQEFCLFVSKCGMDPLTNSHMAAAVSAHNVLCWVLGHKSNPVFGNNLDRIRTRLAQAQEAVEALDGESLSE